MTNERFAGQMSGIISDTIYPLNEPIMGSKGTKEGGQKSSLRDQLGQLVPDSAASDGTIITFLWITFIMNFVWASMLSYRQAVLIVIAGTILYVIFEMAVVRRVRLHYYMWYLITNLLAVSISRLLLNTDMLRSDDLGEALDEAPKTL